MNCCGDSQAFVLSSKRRLVRVSWVERETNKWVLDKIWSVLILRKSRPLGGGEEDAVLLPHRQKKQH